MNFQQNLNHQDLVEGLEDGPKVEEVAYSAVSER